MTSDAVTKYVPKKKYRTDRKPREDLSGLTAEEKAERKKLYQKRWYENKQSTKDAVARRALRRDAMVEALPASVRGQWDSFSDELRALILEQATDDRNTNFVTEGRGCIPLDSFSDPDAVLDIRFGPVRASRPSARMSQIAYSGVAPEGR